MELTPELKATIDRKSIRHLLAGVRFAPIGSEQFRGEAGEYWLKRLQELRSTPEGQVEYVTASKDIGWGG